MLRALLPLALASQVASAATSLNDANGFLWDIQDQDFGDFLNGTSDAYDNWGQLCVSATSGLTTACPSSEVFNTFGATGTLDVTGRVLTSAPWNHPTAGVVVQREWYVPPVGAPASGAYVRIREIVSNPTGIPRTLLLRFGTVDGSYADLGSDGSTVIVATSDGTGTLARGQTWAVTDDNGSDPALTHVWGGPGAIVGTQSVSSGGAFQPDTDTLTAEWIVQIPAFGTASILHFEGQSSDAGAAIALASALETLTPDDLFGMDPAAVASVVNWSFSPVRLTTFGSCPGTYAVRVTGLDPGGTFAAIGGRPGRSVVPPWAPCAGTPLGLRDPFVLQLGQSGTGQVQLGRRVGPGVCGHVAQIVDLATCTVSNTVQL